MHDWWLLFAIRLSQLQLIESRKLACSGFNQAVCSLRFFYRITLSQMPDRSLSKTQLARRHELAASPQPVQPYPSETVKQLLRHC